MSRLRMNTPVLRFCNLSESSRLSKENQSALSRLIYNTDQYIYPAMFGDMKNAELLIPLLFQRNDSMFRLSNCFVAFLKNEIIGLILWTRGSLCWSPQLLRELAQRNLLTISPFLEKVANEYIDIYEEKDQEDHVSLINVSVLKHYSGLGVGTSMLKSFLHTVHACAYSLCVLQDNTIAVKLYQTLGFSVVEEYNGFSIDDRPLPAFRMERREHEEG